MLIKSCYIFVNLSQKYEKKLARSHARKTRKHKKNTHAWYILSCLLFFFILIFLCFIFRISYFHRLYYITIVWYLLIHQQPSIYHDPSTHSLPLQSINSIRHSVGQIWNAKQSKQGYIFWPFPPLPQGGILLFKLKAGKNLKDPLKKGKEGNKERKEW